MHHIEHKIYSLPLYIARFKLGEISFNTIIVKNNFTIENKIPHIETSVDKKELSEKYFDSEALLLLSDTQQTDSVFTYRNWKSITLKTYKRYGTHLNISSEELLIKFSGNTRKSIRVAFEKTEKKFGGNTIALEVYENAKAISEIYPRAFSLSQKTYQSKKLDVGLQPFDVFKKRFSGELDDKKIIFYMLRINNIDVAYLFCLKTSPNILITKVMGYLKEYEAFSVGTTLKWLVIKDLIDKKEIEFLDYNLGESQHKSRFSTDYIECCDRLFYKSSLKNNVKIFLFQCIRKIDDCLSMFADKIGVKQKLRRFLYR